MKAERELWPKRSVRVGDALWNKAKAKAKRRDMTISQVIRHCLARWVAEEDKHDE